MSRRAIINLPARDPDALLKDLSLRLQGDWRFAQGRVLGSMCSEPHPLARQILDQYADLNAGDPGLVPGLMDLEKEAVGWIGGFLGLPGAPGRLVSGGTEANILALQTARQGAAPGAREVLVPRHAHFSFDKAAALMDLDLVKLDLRPDGTVDPALVRRRMNRRTLALVGVAGTTGLGLVDPLEELSDLAQEKGLYLHVDASFGGFVLPFLNEAGFGPAPRFDFALGGVSSVAVDPHKMGRGPIPGGCLVWRNRDLAEAAAQSVGYLSGGRTRLNTLTGTRPGAAVAAIWAVLQALGRPGYVSQTRQVMELTRRFAASLAGDPDYGLVHEPVLNVLGVTSRRHSPEVLAKALRRRGWALSEWPGYLRLVVMPHVTEQALSAFHQELRALAREDSP